MNRIHKNTCSLTYFHDKIIEIGKIKGFFDIALTFQNYDLKRISSNDCNLDSPLKFAMN